MVKDEKMSDMGPRLGRALISLHVKNLSTVWVDWLYVISSHDQNCSLIRTVLFLDTRHIITHIRLSQSD